MKEDVIIPSPGESVSSGILSNWLVGDGAQVEVGDEIFEFESDKVTLAVPATKTGQLSHIVTAGHEVQVSQVVATIDTAAKGKAPAVPNELPTSVRSELSSPVTTEPTPKSPPVSNVVRALLDQHRLDKSTIPGTGKGGRILKQDVLQVVEARSRVKPPPATQTAEPLVTTKSQVAEGPPQPVILATAPLRAAGEETRIPMSQLRKRISENLVQSQRQSAHLTTVNEIDMSRIMQLRTAYGDAIEAKHGVRLGFMSLFVKATCNGLAEFPGVNARIDGDDIVFHDYYDIGVAVSTERGLVVPIIRHANQKTFIDIEKEIRGLAERARDRKLTVDDLVGGTFTITNGGIFGSLLSTPIPTPPQSGILGMHTIKRRPVDVEGEIVSRPMMFVALTYDHRVVDGREAVGFLRKVKEIVEDPPSLLFDL